MDTSFRKIEREILKIDSPAREGGFLTKRIINSQGITFAEKGVLATNSIDGESVKTNNLEYRKTLERIKNVQT